MAMFEEPFVDVPHPSGGTIKIPESLAVQLGVHPGLQDPLPQDQPAGVPQAIDSEMPPGMAAPAQAITASQPAPAVPAVAQPQAQPAAAPAELAKPSTPAPGTEPVEPGVAPTQPVTTQDLRNGTVADAYNAHAKALDQADAAGRAQANLDAKLADKKADALTDQNQKLIDNAAEKAAYAKKYEDEVNRRQAAMDNAIFQYGNTKIDRSVDHPILAAISVLLGGVGAAMAKSNQNPAMDMLMQQIDRKAQAQMQDKEFALKGIGMQRDSLNQLRQQFTDKNALFDATKAAIIDQTQRSIDELVARSGSQQVKVNAMKASAELADKRAALRESASNAQHAQDAAVAQAKAEAAKTAFDQGMKLKDYGLNVAKAQEEARSHDLDFTAKMAELRAKGDKEEADQLKAEHDQAFMVPAGIVKNPDGTVTSHFTPAIQEDGKTMWQASKEAKARMGATASYINALDKLRELRHKNGGHLTNTAESREALQETARALRFAHEAGGIPRLSGEAVDLFEKQISGKADPDSAIKSVMPNLNLAREDAVDDYNDLARHDIVSYTGKKFEFPDPVGKAPPAETETSKQRGVLETPVPNARQAADMLRQLASIERQARSDDPKVSTPAREQLLWATKGIKDKKLRNTALNINAGIIAGKPPLLPDPDKNEAFFEP